MLVAVCRTAILYLFVITAMRLMGKRQVGELEPSELVVAIMISELASVPMQASGTPLASGIIPILALVSLEILMSGAMTKFIWMRKLASGVPSILIKEGVILQQELKKNRFTADELIEELRLQDVLDISTVQYAILETNGKLSVVLYPQYRPMPAGQGVDRGLPVIVVNNGKILSDNLKVMNLDEIWLKNQLKLRGASDASEVYLLITDAGGGVYYLPKEKAK